MANIIFCLFVFCGLTLVLLTLSAGGTAMSDEKRLIKKLLRSYQDVGVVGRPVFNTSDTVRVNYGLALVQILDLDEKNQVLTTNVWNRYLWNDILLTWNPLDYGNVDKVRIPASQIWTPDIVLYNYADTRLKEQRDAMAVVQFNGDVMWIPMAIFKSTCSIDITHFPFDEQTCEMKFGSWTYDGFKLDVDFYDNKDEVDITDYVDSNEWALLEYPAVKNVKHYPCCREPYPDLTFTLKLKRIAAFYNYILILPCVLLSSLTLVIFWLPPESPAKMTLGMNIFVAFFVLLLLLADSTPPAASSIPLIGAYFCLNMILITLSTFLSVIVINLYFRGDRKNNVPKLLKRVMVDGVARLLCMRSEVVDRDSESVVRTRRATSVSGSAALSTSAGFELLNHRSSGTRNNSSSSGRRKIKCPELKYNKFQPPPVAMTTAPPMSSSPATGMSAYPHQTAPTPMPPQPYQQTVQEKQYPASTLGGTDGPMPNNRHHGGPFTQQPPPPQPAPQPEPAPQPTPLHHPALESDIREIKKILRTFIQRLNDKDAQVKVAKEWRVIARVLDRLFFFLYLSTMVVSLTTVFPRP